MEQLILLIVVAFIAGLLLFWTFVLALYIIFCEYYELKIHYLTPKKSGIVNNSSGLSSATVIASGSNQPTDGGSGSGRVQGPYGSGSAIGGGRGTRGNIGYAARGTGTGAGGLVDTGEGQGVAGGGSKGGLSGLKAGSSIGASGGRGRIGVG